MAAEEGSEREMEEFLAGTGVFSGEEPEVEETGPTIHDLPPGQAPPEEDTAPTPPISPAEEPGAEPEAVEPGEEEVPAEEGDQHVVWAKKKYGENPERWAKAAYDQERFIGQINAEKKQAEEIAQNAIEYAQQVEASAQSNATMTMPMSASEEQWVEQALANPAAYAYQAARQGNVQLYNAVIERVAEENPGMAAQVGTQVQLALREEQQRYEAERAQHANGAQQPPDFNADLGASFQRVGVNVQQYGPAMMEKIEEIGEYHPYTLAILGGDAFQRDLAVQAVYDLVRQGQTTTRRVGDEEREAQIARESELRRGAAAVVTGSPHFTPPKQSPFLSAMEEEWKRRGQWTDEE